MSVWCEKSYARILIDNHITDEIPTSMREFDPDRYVAMVKKAGVDSAMVYACCHNGNCYYPTQVGHVHANLNGRDIFGEVVSLLRTEGIAPVAYYTVIYHNHSARNHPEWRITNVNGTQRGGRYWFCCPNNREYVAFAKEQIGEVIGYDIDGIFIDMTFWPHVCCCDACRQRFRKEIGGEMPVRVDWESGEWVRLQRARERWMAGFAKDLTDFIKTDRPRITVTHQFSPVLGGWHLGQSPEIQNACDYASGDFYGGRHQQRFGTKVFSAFTSRRPYEFHTSRCVNLRDHSSTKSEEEMTCSAATTLSAGGAYFFIDAINPDGTLAEAVYDRLKRVSQNLRPFKDKVAELHPSLVADVGLYFSMASHVTEELNGTGLSEIETPSDNTGLMEVDTSPNNMSLTSELRTLREAIGTSVVLCRANIPYRIVTSATTCLAGLKAIIVNNAQFMAADEVERLREFVENGGTLIATGMTSYRDLSGQTSGDFALKDVFGVSFSGTRSMRVNYLAMEGGEHILSDYPAPLVKATSAKTLAKVAQPLFDPDDDDHYASIHSNPPGPAGEYDGLTVNQFGKGTCVYLYSSLLSLQQDAQQSFGEGLFRKHTPSGLVLSSNAPRCVEITVLKGEEGGFLVCFVNYQDELPNVPVRDVKAAVRLPDGFVPGRCRRVSDNAEMDPWVEDGNVIIELPQLDTVEMIELRA